MIEFQNVSKQFSPNQPYAIHDITLSVQEGETLVLLGASGSGKTTLLKMINRLIEPTSGKIIFDGKDIMSYPLIELRRSFGYVFQEIGLFPHMNVEKNLTIVLELLNEPKSKRKARAHELLNLINLNPKQFAKRYPDELSGGQQQRVGVARALAANPKCLLMDEPFGALDIISRFAIQDEVIKIKQSLKKTIVFVTHDIPEAFRLADRIIVMNHGMIEQLGTKEQIFYQPKTDFVRRLIEIYRYDPFLSSKNGS